MNKDIIGIVIIGMTLVSLALGGCGGGGSAPAPPQSSSLATAIPPAPTGVTVTGGAAQATISWNPSSGATSYNIYWSQSAVGTKMVWTVITNAMSPYVQTGLVPGVLYNYFVTATNTAGESTPSSLAMASSNSLPTAPTMAVATGGVGQVTLTWNPVPGATSYNLYWSTASGVLIMVGGDSADPLPIKITGITSPYVWTGTGVNQSGGAIIPPITVLSNTPYYFVITAVTSAGEVPSQEVTATTL